MIQAVSICLCWLNLAGLVAWLTIQCHGGAARVTVPNFVANFTLVQTDPTGEWVLPSLPLNDSWSVTGLGIKFYQNVSIANNALDTLLYGKGADNVRTCFAFDF